jgi:photosystem II stability/assembly factor-like uncharacterized protein
MKHILALSLLSMALLQASTAQYLGFSLTPTVVYLCCSAFDDLVNYESSPRNESSGPRPFSAIRLASISLVGKNMLWAVGREQRTVGPERAVVLHTSNRGQTWDRQLVDAAKWFYDIFFLDSNTGWVAGYDGLVLKSTDGGQTWKKQRTPTQSPLVQIQFIDTNKGWALGEDGQMLRTTDGGDHWQAKGIRAKGWLHSLHFADSLNGWVVGEEGQAYRSSDGGITWQSRGASVLSAIGNLADRIATFRAIRFIDSRIGFIAASVVPKKEGHVPNQGFLLSSRDRGASWSTIVVPGESGILSAQFLSSAEVWVVAGLGEKLFHTLDGGKTWIGVQPVSDGGMVTLVYFVDRKLGWCVVSYGMSSDELFYTIDGGDTWTKGRLPNSD